MPDWRYVDIFIDPNPNCPDGSCQRFTTKDRPRTVRAVLHSDGPGESTLCDVVGWSSAGGGTPCAAQAVTVEDSGAGTAMLVYGGDWGLRLTPRGGGEPSGEPYLLLADASMVVFEDG